MKNKIVFLVKRTISALIDISLLLITTMFLVIYIAEPIAEKAIGISAIREEYSNLCVEYNIKYWDESQKMYLDNLEATDEEKAAFDNDERVNVLEQKIASTMMVEIVSSISVGALLFYIVIPLVSKRGNTLGKKALGLAVINRDGNKLTKLQLGIRGVGFIVIELIIGLMTYGLAPLISLAMVMFGKNGISLHDYLAGTTVSNKSVTELDIVNEEDDEYYKKIAEEEARDLRVGGKKNDK